MMPGTTITYSVTVPQNAKLQISDKLYSTAAEWNVSDGANLIIDVIQDGQSLKTYDSIAVTADGSVTSSKLDLSEYSGRSIQLRIRCFDGGNDNGNGDWVLISSLELNS